MTQIVFTFTKLVRLTTSPSDSDVRVKNKTASPDTTDRYRVVAEAAQYSISGRVVTLTLNPQLDSANYQLDVDNDHFRRSTRNNVYNTGWNGVSFSNHAFFCE